MRFLSFIFFLIMIPASLMHPQNAAEEENSEAAHRITVTAEYEPFDPRHLSSQVTIIGEDEIEASAPRSAADVIAPVVGVQVSRYGGQTEPSMVSIRGASPEQVLVLVNGKRLNASSGGGVDFSTINPDNIERIEVVRGGNSAVYGENAFGGVINIVTKDGYGRELEGGLRYGVASFNTHNLSGHIMGQFGKDEAFDFFLSLHGMSTAGGYSFPDPDEPEGFAVRKNTQGLEGDASFKLGWDINRDLGLRISLAGQSYNDTKGVPGLKEFPTVDATIEDSRYIGQLNFQYQNNPIASADVDLFIQFQKRSYTDPENYLGSIDENHSNLAMGSDISFSRNDDLHFFFLRSIFGYSLRRDSLVSTGLIRVGGDEGEGEVTKLSHSGFYRCEINLFPYPASVTGRIILHPAFRYDRHVVSNPDENITKSYDAVNANLGVLVPFDKRRGALLKGNIGTSYRVPSFNDLFWPATAFAVGNPNLFPEESVEYDIGLIVQPYDFFSFEIAHFNRDVTNLIQWNPSAMGQWRPQNVGNALLNGLELEGKFLFSLDAIASLLEIKGNYSFLFAKDMTEGSASYGLQLPRRAQEKGNVIAAVNHLDGYSIRFEGRYVGARYITAQNTKYLPAYFVLDGTAGVSMFDFFKLNFSVKNILGTEYVDLREFPVPGREYVLEFAARY
jgi:vitamin B12 transporter